MFVTLLTGLFTFPCGVIAFLFLYHPLHDFHGVHTENICVFILVTYALIVFIADRSRSKPLKTEKGWFDLHAFLAFANCIFYSFVVYMADPGTIQTEGFFETIGPCNATFITQTLTGVMIF